MVNKDDKRLVIRIVIIVMLLLIPACKLLLSPIKEKTNNNNKEIDAVEDRLLQVSNKNIDITSLKKDTKILNDDIQNKTEKIPSSLNTKDILSLLLNINNTHLKKDNIVFLETIVNEGLSTLPIRLNFYADETGLSNFFIFLNELPVRSTISNIQITNNYSVEDNINYDLSASSNMMYNLNVDMVINFYCKNTYNHDSLSDDNNKD